MPCLVRYIPLPGEIAGARRFAGDPGTLPPSRTAESLADAGRFERPTGVYAVFATWHGRRVVRLSGHLDRLEDSARRAGFTLKLDRDALCGRLRTLIDDAGFEEARVRVSVSPEVNYLTVCLEPYEGPPMELRRDGVACETVAFGARPNPEAKQTRWIAQRSGLGTGHGRPYETLLVDSGGRILEGTSSNFYVIQHGSLRTADEGILHGIARSIVLDIAPDIVPVELAASRVTDLPIFEEAFLTSASRGIVPVVHIDFRPVGTGAPGQFAPKLIELYDRRAEALEEAL